MTLGILEVAAARHELVSDDALTDVARAFRRWYDTGSADIGVQTRNVLSHAGSAPTATELSSAAYELHQRTGRTAGNGSLMRNAAVPLPHLGAPDALVDASLAVSALTHADPHAGQACILWSMAIRHAILHGEFDIRVGLDKLDAAAWWLERIEEAEQSTPGRFTNNGWVVGAFQAAWSAIVRTPVPQDRVPCAHLRDRHRPRHRHGRGDCGRPARSAVGCLGRACGVATDAARVPGDDG